MNKKIAIATDHAGFQMKEALKKHFDKDFTIEDFGTFSDESMDYPDAIHPAMQSIENGTNEKAIILCGSGQGAMITANKHQKIRAALPWNIELAKLSRQHNDANVITIAARFISFDLAVKMIEIFFSTEFEGGRHQQRIDKIACE